MSSPTLLEVARSIDRTLSGNINYPYRTLSGLGEQVTADDVLLEIDATGNLVVAGIPSAVDVKKGFGLWFIRKDGVLANTAAIVPGGGQTINGAAVFFLTAQYQTVGLVSDGANWLVKYSSVTAVGGNAMELIQTQTTVADVTDVVFAGLNGDADGRYILVAHINEGAGGPSTITLRPNGETTNQASSRLGFAGGAPAGANTASLFLAATNGAAVSISADLDAQTGSNRDMLSRYMIEDAATPGGAVVIANWMETATNITSLEVVSSVADGIGAGSVLSLYRLLKS